MQGKGSEAPAEEEGAKNNPARRITSRLKTAEAAAEKVLLSGAYLRRSNTADNGTSEFK